MSNQTWKKNSKIAPRRFWQKMSSSSTFAAPPVGKPYQSKSIFQYIFILSRTLCHTTKISRCNCSTFIYNGRSKMERNY